MTKRIRLVEWMLAGYLAATAVVFWAGGENITGTGGEAGIGGLLLFRVAALGIIAAFAAIPQKIYDRVPGLPHLREIFPIIMVLPLFEEIGRTAQALFEFVPFGFETALAVTDVTIFGAIPAGWFLRSAGPVVRDVVSFFYLAYYPLLIGSAIYMLVKFHMHRQTHAVSSDGADGMGGDGRGTVVPQINIFALNVVGVFIICLVMFHLLPARNPWHSGYIPPELVRTAPDGSVFTKILLGIQAKAGIKGGAFPSSHAAVAWAAYLGMGALPGLWRWGIGILAAGISVGVALTGYHFGVDAVAGAAVALAWYGVCRYIQNDQKVL